MADSLDDFFAKKDKKRSKDKGKAALSAGALVKELEEGARQADYPVRKDIKTSTAIELLGLDADDADWRDFDDIEKRDYSGLKVKEMSLQDQAEEEQRRLAAEQSEPAVESTPWKMKDEVQSNDSNPSAKQQADATRVPESPSTNDSTVATQASTSDEASKTDKVPGDEDDKSDKASADAAEKKSDIQSAKKKAYVPPSARHLMEPRPTTDEAGVIQLQPMKLSQAVSSRSRGPANVPNIEDERAFPSLG